MRKDLLYNMLLRLGKCFFFFPLSFIACDDLEDKPSAVPKNNRGVFETGTAEMYILSEGPFDQNNSSLARYSSNRQKCTNNYFSVNSQRGLGDTADDVAIHENKIYVVVDVSGIAEVIDFPMGRPIRQISMLRDNGSSRQPRVIAFDEDKAYICSHDGTVTRVGTISLEIKEIVMIGRNTENICIQNGRLYVSNPGGLDYSGSDVDTIVSMIDIATFKEARKMEVGPSPGRILPGLEEAVYVVARGADIGAGDYHLVEINSRTDAVATAHDEKILSFTVDGPIAYLYTYDYQTEDPAIKVFDLNVGVVIQDNLIADGAAIQTPFSIQLNPFGGNVHITEVYNYTVKGDILCFNQQGQLQYRLNDIGLNPNTVVFSDKASQSEVDDTSEDPNAPSASVNKVFEYIPAPGRFTSTTTSAYGDGLSVKQVLECAAEKLKKKSVISLGGFGGMVAVGLHQPIRNDRGEYDFRILGNAPYNQNTGTGALGGGAKSGIVLVLKDESGSGLSGDGWYELTGSKYGKDTETRDYEMTYYRPQPANDDVRWTDNQGGEGSVYHNGYHQRDSYYPSWIKEGEITSRGIRLKDNAINKEDTWVRYCYPWGYADNHPNRSEFSQFEIDWVVNQSESHVELDKIDSVKIYTAVNQNVGWIGEISTEVMTVGDLHFEN